MFVTEITTQPVNPLNVIALEDATLTCLASVDDVTYSWHRDGDNVPPRSIGQNNSAFTIPEVTPFDNGMYYCVAKHKETTVASSKAVVRVNGRNNSIS